VKIKAISVAFPKRVVDNGTIEKWCGLPAHTVAEKLGIRSRRFLDENETGTDLSEQAVLNLQKENPDFDLSKIKLLIVVTQNPDFKLPHNSALLQARLGMPMDVACFDVSLGCSGYVYSLSIAKGFMKEAKVDEALILTCDPYSKCIRKENREVAALFGDAATATWLNPRGFGEIGLGDFGTDGLGAQNLIIRKGGAANPYGRTEVANPKEGNEDDSHLHMNGRAIFNFMMNRIPASVATCLEKNNVSQGEIDLFVFHQASKYLLENLQSKLGLPKEKVVLSMEHSGNTVSSSIPCALKELIDQKKISGRTKMLLSGFGVGLSWASNIVYFNK
jgi:3-oxoacyl-[acyl-carrier-protein] synthase-3